MAQARLQFVPRAGCTPRDPNKGPGENPHAGRALKQAQPTVDFAANPVGHLDVGIEYEPPAVLSVVPGTLEANRYTQICKRDGDMHPFDAETAKAIGVPFVPLERGEDGEWYPAKAKPAAAPAKPSTDERKAG